MLIWNSVTILLEEVLDFICDIERIVRNSERSIAETGFLEDLLVFWLVELGVEFLEE